jgi:cyclically-permuted mutarotase family protein
MKYLTIALSAMSMFITENTTAQKKSVPSIKWKIAAELLPVQGQSKSLGFAGPVTGMHHNVLFVAGGSNFPDSMPWNNGKKKYYDDVFVFIKKEDQLVPLKKSFKLPATIAYPANCSTAQGVLYAGGENENGISNKVWLLQWDDALQNIITKKLPDLPIAVTNAAATVNENIVFVAGGETAAAASNQFFSLDLNNLEKGWQLLPRIPIPVSHTVLVAQSNGHYTCIYLLGGRKKNTNGISDIYKTVYEFDLKKNCWLQKKSLPYDLCAGTGVAEGTNEIFMFGGDRATTFHKVETTIAAINAEKDETKKTNLILQKIELLSTHPGFSKEVLMYNTVKNKWTSIGQIPFDVPATTTAVKYGKEVFIAGGEIKAGVRTPQILEGKISLSL